MSPKGHSLGQCAILPSLIKAFSFSIIPQSASWKTEAPGVTRVTCTNAGFVFKAEQRFTVRMGGKCEVSWRQVQVGPWRRAALLTHMLTTRLRQEAAHAGPPPHTHRLSRQPQLFVELAPARPAEAADRDALYNIRSGLLKPSLAFTEIQPDT